jgi:hypothetical protein
VPVQAVRDGVYMVKCWRIKYRRGRHRDCLKTFADEAERECQANVPQASEVLTRETARSISLCTT